eukprot:m.715926 g.715926  ORF g.715926 m.715926 type:complete len:112 (-) comp22980_c1_seq27:2717-3052(-)
MLGGGLRYIASQLRVDERECGITSCDINLVCRRFTALIYNHVVASTVSNENVGVRAVIKIVDDSYTACITVGTNVQLSAALPCRRACVASHGIVMRRMCVAVYLYSLLSDI